MARFSLKTWIGAAILAAIPAAAQAQVVCLDRTALVESLVERLHQRQVGYGVVSDTAIVELYISPDGSWTVVLTDVTGTSCILAIGQGWQTTPAPGEGA